jgi:hypothetical protein
MDEYDFDLNAATSEGIGGSVSVQTSAGQPVALAEGGAGISVTLDASASGLGTFQAVDCSLDFSNSRATNGMAIAPGRIWGHILCPGALKQTTIVEPFVCRVEVLFLFQACDQ